MEVECLFFLSTSSESKWDWPLYSVFNQDHLWTHSSWKSPSLSRHSPKLPLAHFASFSAKWSSKGHCSHAPSCSYFQQKNMLINLTHQRINYRSSYLPNHPEVQHLITISSISGRDGLLEATAALSLLSLHWLSNPDTGVNLSNPKISFQVGFRVSSRASGD